MKYESDILKRLINTYGLIGNPRYMSEIIKEFIIQGKGRFPELFTYQSDWLAHIDEFGLNPSYTVSYTGQSIYAPNTLERPVKSAILKGSTKYRDIDTGEFLETFEEGRNLELVPVKMPVLTTSNEDGTKTNILTVNEDVTLRGIGDVRDELDLLTGKVTERIGEIVLDGSESWILTSDENDLTIRFALSLPLSKPTNIICEQFKVEQTYGKEYECIQLTDNKTLVVRISKEKATTLEMLKQWLSQNPITVQYELATPTVKTVDLTILDQNGQIAEQLMSFNGGTHFITGSLEGSPLPSVSVSVETDLEETLKVCSLEGNTI